MSLVDQALDLVMMKVPDLAAEAAKEKMRASTRLKAKNTAALAAKALQSSGLTTKDRAVLTRAIQGVSDSSKSAQLPPTRITAAQLTELENEAERDGVTISVVIRRRLFGE